MTYMASINVLGVSAFNICIVHMEFMPDFYILIDI